MIKVMFLFFFLLWGCGSSLAQTSTVVDQGRELYLSYGCALCHGKQGDGNGLESQKFDPPPTNFHNPKAYLHGNDQDSISRSIHDGIKEENSIMPSFDHIPPEELQQIVKYLESMQTK